jgi:predicted dehydrogenase
MAVTLDEARRMVAASEAADRLYMVSQSRRYVPKLEAIAQAIRDGAIGKVTDIVCQFYLGAHFDGFRAEMDHVVVGDMSIHHFDLARMFTGLDPLSVYCEDYTPAGSWFRDGPAAMAIYRMTDNVRFGYMASWCAEGRHTSWHGDWRIVGTEGSITFERDEPAKLHKPIGDKFVRDYQTSDIQPIAMEVEGQHGALREFLRYLTDGTKPQGECHDNIKSFAMQTAAIESSQAGRRIDIDV